MVEGIRGCRFTDFVSLCTDDVHAKDLLETGHINRVLKSVIAQGIDPITAIRWATLNGALDCIDVYKRQDEPQGILPRRPGRKAEVGSSQAKGPADEAHRQLIPQK